MKYLVGDIGNTLTKISILNNRLKIIRSYNIKTTSLSNKNKLSFFLRKFLHSNLNKKILFSSVVPSTFKIIKSFLRKKNFKIFEINDLNLKKIIKLKVDNISQVGSDRIANAIGANSENKKNCIIIDFGTATTFDIVQKEGVYIGGVIAPGVNSSIINLNKSTALLPMLSLKKNAPKFGKNTRDALNAGFLWGYQGLINNIIKKISYTSKKNYKIILTGGYAKTFKRYILKKSLIDQNITIKGIIKVYKELLI